MFEEIHIFGKFNLCLFTNGKDWNEVMSNYEDKKFTIEESELEYTNALSTVIYTDGVIFNMLLKKDSDIFTILHESVHIVDFLIENIGIDHTEFRAYTVEYLTRNIYNYLKNL